MKMSKYYMPTLKLEPNSADVISAKLLLRAGMVRKNVAGVYTFLPLGFRVLKKIEAIIREEMDNFDAQEVLMSALQPKEIWEASGRWETNGPEMFRLKDRHNREFCLGPTHEEYFTSLVMNELNSYKQLPLNLYQIQTKFRDERRPRFGLIRSREFIMKDAYTFDENKEAHEASYKNMWHAYESIFNKMKINFRVVRGDSGNMGGKLSHEFHAITPNGESTLAYCGQCNFAETDEVAVCNYSIIDNNDDKGEMTKVETPNIKTINELQDFFKLSGENFIKTLLYKTEDDKRIFAIMIPGNRSLNIVKLAKFIDESEDLLVKLEEHEVYKLTGSIIGFIGPFGLNSNIEIIGDSRVFQIKNGICGANEKDYHFNNVNLEPENYTIAEDLLQVEAGDTCPECDEKLLLDMGTEVGNIFQLGTKYSDSLKATFLDKNGKAQPFYMGSYGIGVSRCLAAVVEQYYDDKGITWPLELAPYQIIITIVNHKDLAQVNLGNQLYDELQQLGYEVLLDDRKERAGKKFADRDLIGIPIRITAGRNAKDGVMEFSLRKDNVASDIHIDNIVCHINNVIDKG